MAIELTPVLGTKAQTLEQLQGKLKNADVLPVFRLPVAAYFQQPAHWYQKLCQAFGKPTLLAIRSSSCLEDGHTESLAGHFVSRLNIPMTDEQAVYQAIDQVIASYGKTANDQEVLIQPMLSDVAIAGVVFTLDMDQLAPYYVLEYNAEGSTDAVTSGSEKPIRTYVYFKDAPVPPAEPWMEKLFNTCRELETLFNLPALDIEFGYTHQEELFIFQVRPLARATGKALPSESIDFASVLEKLSKKIDKLSRPHPSMLGKRALFGVMPDWNPAEIIGIRPKPLALSLYMELITDKIWAYQRDLYGYRDLKCHPLMVSFFGLPYIDIRVDFNSFIPKSLDRRLAEKLVDIYLNQLVAVPHHHDKIEFEVVHSCYYFDLDKKLHSLAEFGFNQNEQKRLEYALLELTNRIIQPDNGLFEQDLRLVQELPKRQEAIMHSDLALVDKIYWLIEECKRYGTLPFAGIARTAFIAVQLLRSFVSAGIFSDIEVQAFLNSLNTVNKQLTQDVHNWQIGKLSQEEFLEKYGHLRPGTYDIQSPRYDQALDNYFPFASLPVESNEEHSAEFILSDIQYAKLECLVREHGMHFSVERLIDFIRRAIEEREASKFVFSRTLSQIIECIAQLGERAELSREDMAFVDIQIIRRLYTSLTEEDVSQILCRNIEENKPHYTLTRCLKLPSLIVRPEDVYGFFLDAEKPNFITLNTVEAPVILESEIMNGNPAGCIVFIKAADPGYDFLFSKGIAGLITMYGGANSHMAIRCAELDIPAVIGVGESLFNQWSRANKLKIDAANQQVIAVGNMPLG